MRKFSIASIVLAVVAVVAFSNLAVAQYDDDERYEHRGYSNDARQYGYQSGYRDGYSKGRHEGRENDPGDVNTRALENATHGYQDWMGDVRYFQEGYRDGYQNGFRAGYQATNHRWGGNSGTYYPSGAYGQTGQYGDNAYQIGYSDGADVAREDAQYGKPYNSQPRGRYDDMDHGYRREYGSKDAYRSEYAQGYRAGYDSSRRY
jgi:hypothetical protein